jgi:hypothetical protein
MARFERPSDRQDVRRAAPVHLKGKPYGVNEHFQPEVLKIRKDLLSIHKEARKRKLKSVFKRDQLYIEGELSYLSLLPPSLPNSLYSIINIYTEKELIHIDLVDLT